MTALAIAKRFCGPPESANGGYFCGLVASLSPEHTDGATAEAAAARYGAGGRRARRMAAIAVRNGAELVAQARRRQPLELEAPVPPSYLETLDASVRYPGFAEHPFPTCFVCGPQRARGDGLRVFAGPVERARDFRCALGAGCLAGSWRRQGAARVHVGGDGLPGLLRCQQDGARELAAGRVHCAR